MSNWLDELTSTLSVDHELSNLLREEPYSKSVAELIIWNEWRTHHLGAYVNLLPALASRRFKRDLVESASRHSAQLIYALSRDLSLPPYLAMRGLPLDGLFFIRRALEHLAVLTHVWKHTNRLQALDEPDSDMYRNAFQAGPPSHNGRRIQWRFEALDLLGEKATNLYRELSALTAHGGPHAAGSAVGSLLSCRLLARDAPSEEFALALSVMIESTQISTVNLCALFRRYMEEKGVSDDAVEKANSEAFALLKVGGATEGSTAMARSVRSLLEGVSL